MSAVLQVKKEKLTPKASEPTVKPAVKKEQPVRKEQPAKRKKRPVAESEEEESENSEEEHVPKKKKVGNVLESCFCPECLSKYHCGYCYLQFCPKLTCLAHKGQIMPSWVWCTLWEAIISQTCMSRHANICSFMCVSSGGRSTHQPRESGKTGPLQRRPRKGRRTRYTAFPIVTITSCSNSCLLAHENTPVLPVPTSFLVTTLQVKSSLIAAGSGST